MTMRVCTQRLISAFLVALPCLYAAAQRAEPTGSVTGRVLCSDTNGPARMASVVLVPVVDTSFLPKPNAPKDAEPPRQPMTNVMESGLDGTFLIPHVRPGNYYVVPEMSGYLQPLSLFTREQLNKPDEDTARQIARLLTPVTVVADHGTQVEARLIRGASIGGTVRFDDGTSAGGIGIMVLHKDKAGKWVSYRNSPARDANADRTNDLGDFRIAGLPAGEYLIQANLTLDELVVDHLFENGGGGSSSSTRYSLAIFYGDAYRARDAKPLKLAEGEDAPHLDITVRLSQFHTVAGSVLAPDGHVANAADVALLWKDDRSSFVSTPVRREDNSFHFEYVPEGEYTLSVSNARDVSRVDIPNCEGCVPPFRTEEKTVRNFGSAEQQLVLHSDVQSLSITVMPATAK